MTANENTEASATQSAADSEKMILLGHDLRAAVSDVIGGLRLISQDGLNDPTKLQLERVRASGEILARLLEEGLSLMLGEDELVATDPANLQMPRFLYDVEMRWSGRASENGLSFRIKASEEVPTVLTLDRIALERVLSNILSNAIKYTEEGGVTLDIEMAETGALRFTVTDQGPGFSDEALQRLFQYQGRPDNAGKPGLGLGMHIAKNMTGRLGGEVIVENLQGGGARVTLDLPPDTWTLAAPEITADLPDLSRTKVLIAEDNQTNQTIIGHMLAKMGAQFETAQDGVEAMQWLERESFDLALVDIEMPRMTGIEVIRAFRAKPGAYSQMPIIAITAYVLRTNRDAIYAAGADAILAKPLAGLDSFGRAIANVLLRHQGTDAEPSQAVNERSEIDRDSFDRLMQIAGPAAARELLDRIHSDLRRTERGLIAGLGAADAAVLRAETHVLIALAGAVGATHLQALAQTLNVAAHRKDFSNFADQGSVALAQLDRLIHFVAQERALRGDIE